MKKHKLHRIAVFDRESQLIVGTLTHKDILLFLLQNFSKEMQKIFSASIKDLKTLPISTKVHSADSKQQLVHTFESLLIRRVSAMPIVDKGKLLGLIHKKDLYYVLKNFELEKVYHYYLLEWKRLTFLNTIAFEDERGVLGDDKEGERLSQIVAR